MRTSGFTAQAYAAAAAAGGGAANELVVQRLLLRSARGSVLRVPLCADDPGGARQLDRFHLPVGCPPARDQGFCQAADALVVHRVAVLEMGGAARFGQQRPGGEIHRVLAHPVVAVADVLLQRAAERNVEHLHAAAQGQHRQVELDGRQAHGDVELVVDLGDAVQVLVGGFLAVAARVDIAAAG